MSTWSSWGGISAYGGEDEDEDEEQYQVPYALVYLPVIVQCVVCSAGVLGWKRFANFLINEHLTEPFTQEVW